MMVYVVAYLVGSWYREITGQNLLPLIGLCHSEFGPMYARMARARLRNLRYACAA